jgi:hypothetical protein
LLKGEKFCFKKKGGENKTISTVWSSISGFSDQGYPPEYLHKVYN